MTKQPLFTRRAELILAGWLFAFCMSLGIIQCGCRSPELQTAGITAAACVLLDRLPASAGYLAAAADTFRAFAKETPPTPAEVHVALASLPNATLTESQQVVLWAATVAAYRAAWSRAQTPADRQALRDTLQHIGDALAVAVRECGPSGPTPGSASSRPAPPPALDRQGLFDMSKTIGKQLSQ